MCHGFGDLKHHRMSRETSQNRAMATSHEYVKTLTISENLPYSRLCNHFQLNLESKKKRIKKIKKDHN